MGMFGTQKAAWIRAGVFATLISVAASLGSLFAFRETNYVSPAFLLESTVGALEKITFHRAEPVLASGALDVKVPIFIYHSVRPHIPHESQWQDAYDVTPELLEQELRYLYDHGYTTITPDMLAQDIATGTTSPIVKPVVLTFDDGWENEYRYAFPLLKKYHATATFYIFSNPISRKPHFFTWNQIKEMDEAGMTIGAHTLTHPYLQKIPEAQLRREIAASKSSIEKHLGHSIRHFASPFGYMDAHIEALLKADGYQTGRTTYKGVLQNDPFRLKGFLVTDSLDDFIHILDQ